MALYNNKISHYQDGYSLRQRIENDVREYMSPNQLFQAQANLDLQCYAGSQDYWNNQYTTPANQNMNQYVFNMTRRLVQQPAGYQIQHSKSTLAIPIENGTQEGADQISKVLSFIERNAGFQKEVSDAFLFGTLITGLNLIEIYVDYSEDPVSGDIKYDRVPGTALIMDPYWTKMDLSDCNSIFRRSYRSQVQAAALLPDYKNEILNMTGQSSSDGLFQYMPQNTNWDTSKLLTYDEYFYLDLREATHIIDKNTLQFKEWLGTEEQLRYILQQDPNLMVEHTTIPTVNQGILVEGEVYYAGPSLLGIDEYPFTPWVGYHTPELTSYEWRMPGMVRALRDPQFLFNRRQVIALDILESQTTSGYYAKEGSVVDPESLYKVGQGQVIWKTKGSAPDDVTRIQPPDLSPGIMQVTADMGALLRDISAVTEEQLGSASDDIPGILAMARQGAGLIGLQSLFNNSDIAQKICQKKAMKIVQKSYVPSKIERIIKEQPVEEFYTQNFGKYDIDIVEGFYTSTQKQQQLAQMVMLQKEGIVEFTPEEMLEGTTIQNKGKILERIQQQKEEVQKQQEAQAELQQRESEATIKMVQAQTNYQEAGAIERASRIPENYELSKERQAEAERNEQQALLNRARAMKEIQDIDFSQFERFLTVVKMLKQDDREEKQLELRQSTDIGNMNNNVPLVEQPPTIGL